MQGSSIRKVNQLQIDKQSCNYLIIRMHASPIPERVPVIVQLRPVVSLHFLDSMDMNGDFDMCAYV